MNHTLKPILTIMIISIVHLLSSCEEFLDEKPEKSLVVPESLDDLAALLEFTQYMNNSLHLGIILADDYYTTDEGLQGFSYQWEREAYTWSMDLADDTGKMDAWSAPYAAIFYSNVVLEKLRDIAPQSSSDQQMMNTIKGKALFYRASHYFELSQYFAAPYPSGSSENPVQGLPLKRNANVNERPAISDLETTYRLIEEDLLEAADLLPGTANYPYSPTQKAAWGMLSRFYLVKGDYEAALRYANKTLEAQAQLMDLAQLEASGEVDLSDDGETFLEFNPEVIFHSQLPAYSYLYSSQAFVHPALYDKYAEGDLRKQFYYFEDPQNNGLANFRGSYTGSYLVFGGLATDELYLNKAECLARLGDSESGLAALNYLLERRHLPESFRPYTASGQEEALDIILLERRKELAFRGSIRWMDVRRLLGDPQRKVHADRTVDGFQYGLGDEPADYLVQIPPYEQELNGSL
ncbi:RagB/SusD family nutrient uptake outer membrane protein [Echinicola sp. 20G]|uniref:RagB/SusD family nutrient uptake outer membrane protein n=1 Tax=Echinicola sp. 20G TaxID=2781961 RepID=UPI00191057B3|nr:RagB/SusD family nutrient uptake outer membrane protein [Echinicola sp. 20G]